jgi:uncharacterized protein DUF3800
VARVPFEELALFIRGTRYRESVYSMIGSFLDESFDRQGVGVFGVGGLMGRGSAVFELERRWERLLTRPDIDIKYFKASECERGDGQFRKFVVDPKNITPDERAKLDSISHEFLNSITEPLFGHRENTSFLVLCGLGVRQDDFYDVISDAKARAVLGDDPYRLAYALAMMQGAWAMKQLHKRGKLDECVSFVCDSHEQYGPYAYDEFMKLKEKNPNAAHYMGTYTSGDDKDSPALQAADAVVFEIRRSLHISLGQWKESLRAQFKLVTERHNMFLIQHCNREHLLYLVEHNKPGEPFDLDSFMEDEGPDEDIQI